MTNPFGTFFGTQATGINIPVAPIDFIPKDDKEGTIDLRADPEWLGLNSVQMQYWAYCFCAPLASIIDRLAECDINGEVEILKKNDDYTQSSVAKRLQGLLEKPNPIDSWEDFRAQQVVFKKLFGFCPVFAIRSAGMDTTFTKSLWNLNPYYAQPVFDYSFDMYGDKPAIKEWRVTILGTNYTIPSEDIFVLRDGFIDNINTTAQLPISKVAGLDYAISNICAAMEADNVLLKKKGPLGIFSHDPKPDNVAGYVSMTNEEKKEIQKDLQNYGLSWDKFQYVVAKLPIKWNAVSFNVKDLMTKETIRQAIDMLCDRFSYPAELMSGKNATYENRTSAEKFLYQNNIIPTNLRDMRVYNRFFKTSSFGIKISDDFSFLPVLQEDVVRAGEASNYTAQANLLLFQNSVIHLNAFRQREGIDTKPDDDIYYSEYLKKYKVNVTPKSTGTAA